MPPARVAITALPGEAPSVTVNGLPLPAVRSVQVTATGDGVPQVAVVFAAAQVDWDGEAAITVVKTGSAVEFADGLDPRRLEHDALNGLEFDATQGEAFAAAVRAQAVEFDDRP
jgi:hypothetical protein